MAVAHNMRVKTMENKWRMSKTSFTMLGRFDWSSSVYHVHRDASFGGTISFILNVSHPPAYALLVDPHELVIRDEELAYPVAT